MTPTRQDQKAPRFRCLTCGCELWGPVEVRGHWGLHNLGEGHSWFHSRRGRLFQQTIEGLQRRGLVADSVDRADWLEVAGRPWEIVAEAMGER